MSARPLQTIVDKLHAYYDARKRAKDLRQELVKIAVELGMDQEIAANSDVAAYIDGHLAGRGHLPAARKTA